MSLFEIARLKALYEQNFRFSTDLSAEISAASERYRNSVEDRLQYAREVYQEGFERKCGYHRERYQRPYEKPDWLLLKSWLIVVIALVTLILLAWGRFGIRALLIIENYQKIAEQNQALDTQAKKGGKDPIQHLYGSRGNEGPVMRQDADGIGDVRREQRAVHGFQGVLNDGVRENAVKRLRGFTEQLRTAAGAMAERAGRLVARTKDLARAVYQNNHAEQPLERKASHEIDRAGDALSRASAVEMKIEHCKELERERAREHSKGFDFF